MCKAGASYFTLSRARYFLVCAEAKLEEYLDFVCLQSKVATKSRFQETEASFQLVLPSSVTPFPPVKFA